MQRQFTFDLIVDDARYADAAGVSEALQPPRDVYTVAVDLLTLLPAAVGIRTMASPGAH
jgi:hypothetical protein